MSNKTNTKNEHYFTKEELRNDESYKEWKFYLKGAANTEFSYLQHLQRFTDFTQKTPKELIDAAESELGMPMTKREIFKLIPLFHAHLEDMGFAPKSIKVIIWGAIASFYKNPNDIPFPKPPKSMRSVKPRIENTKRSNKEEIQKAIKIASKRDRAIILSQVSSGLSASDISNLTYRQIIDGYDQESNVCTIHYERQKTGIVAHCFLNPEACEAIFEYCEVRNAPPASDKAWDKKRYEKRKTTLESPLFIREAISDKYLENHDEKYRRLSSSKISNLYISIVNRAGLETEKSVMNTFRSHNMRKYFNATLKNKGMEYDDVEYMMGHKLFGVRNDYDDLDPEVLKKRYMKVMHHLYIEEKGEIDVTSTPEYQKALKKNEELEKQVLKNNEIKKYVDEKMNAMEAVNEKVDKVISLIGKDMFQELSFKIDLQEMMREDEA